MSTSNGFPSGMGRSWLGAGQLLRRWRSIIHQTTPKTSSLVCNPKINPNKLKFSLCRPGHHSEQQAQSKQEDLLTEKTFQQKTTSLRMLRLSAGPHLPRNRVSQLHEGNFLLNNFCWIPTHRVPPDLGQPHYFSSSCQVCQNVCLKEGNMENILYVNIVHSKPLKVWSFLLGRMLHFNCPNKTEVIENIKSLQNFLNTDKTKTLLLILPNCLVFLICFSSATWFFQCLCMA